MTRLFFLPYGKEVPRLDNITDLSKRHEPNQWIATRFLEQQPIPTVQETQTRHTSRHLVKVS